MIYLLYSLFTTHVAGNNIKYTYNVRHLKCSLTLHKQGHIVTDLY